MTRDAETAGARSDFLSDGGEMGALISAHDWARTPLGPIETWPTSLRTTIGLILRSPVPIVTLWGEAGTMIYNDAYSVFAGGRHPTLLGSAVREGWPEVADFNDNVMKVGLSGGVLSYTNQELTLYRSGEPEQVFMNLDYSPVIGEAGKPIGVIAIVVETSTLVAATRELAASEARLRALITATSSIVFRMSADWREMRQLDGRGFLADTDAPTKGWLDTYIVQDDQPKVRAAIAQALSSRAPFHVEHQVRQADGSTGWAETRAVPLLDAAGEVVEWFGSTTDVSERHRAEEQRIAQQNRQRRLFEQAPGFVVIMRGPEHVVEFVNDAHRKVFNSDHWIGMPMGQAFPLLEAQGFLAALDNVYATGKTAQFNAQPVDFRPSPDSPQQLRYLTFIYAPLYDDAGEVTGVFCEGYDVTAAHRVQQRSAAIAELNDLMRDTEDPDDLAYAVSEILGRELEVSRVGYGTIDKIRETITIDRDWNAPGIRSLAGTLHFRDYGSYIDELKRGETVVIPDATKDPRTASTADALIGIQAQSLINMPVTEQGGLVALLYLNHATAREWSEDDIAFVREVAERTRTAVERRRAEAELHANAERLRFLDRLSRETATSFDADHILATTTRMLGEHLGVSICAYADMEADGDHFTIRGDWSAEGSPSIRGYYSLADFGALAVSRLRAGKPLIIADNLRELPSADAATFQAIGIRATISMPLVKEGRLTALMAIHHRTPHHWTERELALLTEVTERSWAHIERVRSDAEAREHDAQFRTLAEVLPNHVWTATPEGLLDWANGQAYQYAGMAPGTFAGHGWAMMVHPEDIAMTTMAWQEALESGSTYQNEYRLRRADGTYRWHLARGVPIRDGSGKIVRWVGTNTDVDDQKNSEAVLEARLAERTAALAETNERLQQSQKMEAIGNLTGGVAHDFNNLLSAILGSLELLRKRMPPDPQLLRLVGNALEGVNRGASLTRRMLAFARRQDLRTERIDVATLVTGMRELLERSLGPTVRVVVDLPEGLPQVQTDANQLESALLNLAVNARDAMAGEGQITISGRATTLRNSRHGLAPGSYLRLAIADTGEGMDEATLKRATEPFFTTKGVGKGTGLGLSMVHGLATQSGGTLILSSEVGRGTTAEIWLPALTGEVPAAASEPSVSSTDGGTATRPLRVLAVDDDALVLMNTAAMLEDMGHTVVEALSAREALDLLRSTPEVDLVITDHAMPQMTGAQLAAEIRKSWPDLPILLATGYAELPGGVTPDLPRLPKPFSQKDLEQAVSAVAARG